MALVLQIKVRGDRNLRTSKRRGGWSVVVSARVVQRSEFAGGFEAFDEELITNGLTK